MSLNIEKNSQKLNTNFPDLAAMSDFEARKNVETQQLRQSFDGKTPMNVLSKVAKSKDNTAEKAGVRTANNPMTLKNYALYILGMRCLTGQNYSSMISEEDVKAHGIKLAPYAKPFYDKDGNKYYDLASVAKTSLIGKMFYEQNKTSEVGMADKLNSGNQDMNAVLKACEDLQKVTGIALNTATKANTFMPSRISSLKHAKDMLGKGKRFNKMSGVLYMNVANMNPTEVLTTYVSRCAIMSVDTNFKSLELQLMRDKDFLSLGIDEKKKVLNNLKGNFKDIQYDIHSICADLIASEMVKTLPGISADERKTISQSYLLSATQRINTIGEFANDPYIMKFVASTVTDAVSRFNANYQLSANEISKINESMGYKKQFEGGNRFEAIYGAYSMPFAGEMKYSAYKPVEIEVVDVKEKSKPVVEQSAEVEENAPETPETTMDGGAVVDDGVGASDTPKEKDGDKFDFDQYDDAFIEQPPKTAFGYPTRTYFDKETGEPNKFYVVKDENGRERLVRVEEDGTKNTSAEIKDDEHQLDDPLKALNDWDLAEDKKKEGKPKFYNVPSDMLSEDEKAKAEEEKRKMFASAYAQMEREDREREAANNAGVATPSEDDKIQSQKDLINSKLVDSKLARQNKKEEEIVEDGGSDTEPQGAMEPVDEKNDSQDKKSTGLREQKQTSLEDWNGSKDSTGEGKKKNDLDGKIKQGDKGNIPIKPGKTGKVLSDSSSLFGDKSYEQIETNINVYLNKLTSKALSEKSLRDKKKVGEVDDSDSFALQKARAIAGSQSTIESVFNGYKDRTTRYKAMEIMAKSLDSESKYERVEGQCLNRLVNNIKDEGTKVLSTYVALCEKADLTAEESKLLEGWKQCKTTSSFMNYYVNNVSKDSQFINDDQKGETKKISYANVVKNKVKQECRVASGRVIIFENLDKKGAEYFILNDGRVVMRDEKGDKHNTNCYKIYESVSQGDKDAKVVENKIYSDLELNFWVNNSEEKDINLYFDKERLERVIRERGGYCGYMMSGHKYFEPETEELFKQDMQKAKQDEGKQ